MRLKIWSPLLLALLGQACGESTASSDLDIVAGRADQTWGSSVVLVSDTALGSCTGTALTSRHVLTAAHCVQGGTGKPYVNIYGRGQALPQKNSLAVLKFDVPAGIDSRRLDFQADDQRFADLAVLTLAEPLPESVKPLPLASSYPGRGATLLAVGTGEHDKTLNAGAEMRSRTVRTFSTSDSSGAIVMGGSYTNKGDSGGPILVRGADGRWQQLGILNGTVEYQQNILDRYTSVHEERNRLWIQKIISAR